MTKVLLIGAGWLGRQLIPCLLQAGCQVTATCRRSESLPTCADSVTGLCWDGCSEPDEALRQAAADAVLICLVPPGRRSGASGQYLQTIDYVVQLAGKAKALLFCSTTSVFSGCTGRLNEQSPLSLSAAAALPVAAEQLALAAPRTVLVRLGGLIGPGRHPSRFCQYGPLQGAALPVNLVHAADVCQAFVMLTLAPLVHGSIVHLVAPHHPDKQAFYQRACQHAQLPAPTFCSPTEPSRFICSDIEQQLVGFRFRHRDLFQALEHC